MTEKEFPQPTGSGPVSGYVIPTDPSPQKMQGTHQIPRRRPWRERCWIGKQKHIQNVQRHAVRRETESRGGRSKQARQEGEERKERREKRGEESPRLTKVEWVEGSGLTRKMAGFLSQGIRFPKECVIRFS